MNKENITSETNTKKHPKLKYLFNIVLVFVLSGVSILITFLTGGEQIFSSFSNVDWRWIGVAVLMMFCAVLIQSLILFCFARLYTRDYHFHQALANDSIGRFWSGVTPAATGGQFMQVYTYKRQGIPVSSAASIMIMFSICYQVVLIMYGVFALIFRMGTLVEIEAVSVTINGVLVTLPVIPLVIIGFGLNLGYIAILLLMSYSVKFHHFILGPCISFLAKIRIVKNPDKHRENLRIQVENFKIELKRLISNIPFLVLTLFLFFISLTFLDAIPAVLAKALLNDATVTVTSIFDSVFYSNFHQMVTGLLPIPGGALVSEYFFSQLFSNILREGTSAALVIWRTITFTLPLVIGAFVAAFYRSSPKEEVSGKDINRATFVETIQRATYAERAESAATQFATMQLTRRAILSKLRGKRRSSKTNQKSINKNSDKILNKTDWDEVSINDDED